MPPVTRRATRALALAAVGILLLAACGDDDAAPATTDPTTVAPEPTAPPDTEAPPTTVQPEPEPEPEPEPDPLPEPEPQPEPQRCVGFAAPPPGETVVTIEVDGREREYAVYIPDPLDVEAPAPVVFNLHGRGSNRTEQFLLGGFAGLADRDGVVLVHPQGIAPEGQGARQWNFAQAVDPSYSDEEFILAVLEDVAEQVCVDRDRVYSTGMSSGGFMSSTLACLHGDVFAAVAPVAGSFFPGERCATGPSVPFLTFHGLNDAVVRYDSFGIMDVAESWARRNGCEPTAEQERIGVTTKYVWNCPDGVETIIYVADDGGHTWPGFPIDLDSLGFTNRDVVATELIWEFFARHSKAQG